MKFRWIVLLLPFFATAYAGEHNNHSKMDIKIVRDDGNGAVEFSSDDLDFDLMEMQVGENRSIVDSTGQNVLITRTDKGFDLQVDGETIEIPDPLQLHSSHDFATDVDVDIIHKQVFVDDADEGGAVIVTRDAVDAETQDQVRSLLQAAGVEGEVRFVEGPRHGPHMIKDVRVIREESL